MGTPLRNPVLLNDWIILAMTDFKQADEALRTFQDTIFLQDKPIVGNRRPLRLPLAPGAGVVHGVVPDRDAAGSP
jgi:hypothetical protein